MCGIVYAHDFNGNAVNNGVLNLFDKQRSRGLAGFGLFDGQEKNIVRATTEEKILKWLCKYDSNLILFHHRFPTSAVNTRRTAHPFTTRDYFGDSQYILVHNGHISNSDTLRADHEDDMGIEYQSVLSDGSYNDSEALLWDLALFLEGKQKDLKFYGQAAFVCVKLHKGKLDRMYFGTNGNPLNLLRTNDGIALSSEGPGEAVAEQMLYTWNYELKRLTKRKLEMRRWSKAYSTSDWESPRYGSSYPSASYPYRSSYNTGDSYYDSNYDEDDDELNEAWNYHEESRQEIDDWLEENGLEPFIPSVHQISRLADIYLEGADGDFERAYDLLEMDYMEMSGKVESLDEYEQMRVFEEALMWLADDPEWTDYNAQSSRFSRDVIEVESTTSNTTQTALAVVN